jgi:acyl carrier protein
MNCRQIDINLSDQNSLKDQLFAEILTPTEDSIIAYRHQHRWHQIFKPISLTKEVKLKENGVYLILGSLEEGLGKVWLEYLPKTTKLILIDQSPFTQTLDKEYLFIPADITDEKDLRKAIEKGEAQLGKIDGVFYSTPMSNPQGTAPIQLLKLAQWDYNIETKMAGLYTLKAILKDKEIDFCCVQSSLSSIIGGLGLSAYGSANAMIDALAEKEGWLSINWDACQFEENESVNQGFGASLAKFALTPSEVWQVTQRVLALNSSHQIIVSKENLSSRFVLPQLKEDSSSQHTRPSLANDYIAPRNEIENQIATIWQDILGIEKVGIYDSFFDLGGHSLLAIQVLSRLRETFQLELSMGDLLFENPTVAGLAEAISQKTPPTEDLETITSLLAEVQGLSPEEIQQQLNQF